MATVLLVRVGSWVIHVIEMLGTIGASEFGVLRVQRMVVATGTAIRFVKGLVLPQVTLSE